MIDKFIHIYVIMCLAIVGVCFIFVGIPFILAHRECKFYDKPLALKHSIQLEEIERRLKKTRE